jgi:hypothetical protein
MRTIAFDVAQFDAYHCVQDCYCHCRTDPAGAATTLTRAPEPPGLFDLRPPHLVACFISNRDDVDSGTKPTSAMFALVTLLGDKPTSSGILSQHENFVVAISDAIG